ncbi:MAG: hypothetical protein QOJ00_1916 [Actinomycetota bacterium]
MERTTEDGRWIVVDGRRWRATDPAIPDALRSELVDELMDARRRVAAARRATDSDAERRARDWVQLAKVALGERGDPWWEAPTDRGQSSRIDAAVLALAHRRGPDRTICPSDAARAVGGAGWRSLMPAVRDRLRALATDGVVEVLQRGEVLNPAVEWRGPVRVRLKTQE